MANYRSLLTKIVSTKIDSGEDLSYLINRKTEQILPLTFYYSLERRLDSQSSTIKAISQSLAFLYDLDIRLSFNLDAYLSGAIPYDQYHLEKFIQNLFTFLQSGETNPKVAGAIYNRLQSSSFNVYWKHIINYILYWLKISYAVKKNKHDSKDIESLTYQFKRLSEKANIYITRSDRTQTLKLLNKEKLNKVLNCFYPQTSIFKNESVKYRNWAIFSTLLDSGMRKGELLNLRLIDLPLAPSTSISIRRRPDSLDDPRKNRPRVKSIGRTIAVSSKTIQAINYYIQTYRHDYANLPFVFLNDDSSMPLSITALNSIFAKIPKKTGINISAHALRHTRHYNRLIELGWANGAEIVRLEGGWSPRFGIPETYKRQYLIDESNKTSPLILDKLLQEYFDGKPIGK